jgi:AcrR family transcriptional regulator
LLTFKEYEYLLAFSSDSHLFLTSRRLVTERQMRRQPKQARSQQRVDHLLDVAAQLFEEVGYDAATTNAIAARAGVSIGSLYQFFPNKQAIMEALVERYRAGMTALMTPETGTPVGVLLDRIIEGVAAFDRSHAGFRELFLTADVATAIHRELVGRVDALIAVYFPALDAEMRRQGAAAGVAIVKGMMKLSQPPDNLPLEVVLRETSLTLKAYLRTMLERAGAATAADLRAQQL